MTKRFWVPAWVLAVAMNFNACVAEKRDEPQVLMEAPEWAHLRLNDGDWDLLVVDPTVDGPYYQGRRFALSGMVPEGRWQGKPLFGALSGRDGRDPEHHDHVGGLSDEFDINGPDSYEAAGPDGVFMKIGTGFLRRPEKGDYGFSRKYEVVSRPEISVTRESASAIRFDEVLYDEELGLGYRLTTELRLKDGELISRRTLENLCDRVLETEFYGHHFLRLDDVPPGPAYRIEFPETGEPDRFSDADGKLVRTPDGLAFAAPMEKGSYYFGSHPGLGWPVGSKVTVVQSETGLGLDISLDHAVDRFAVWGTTELICPEPFIRIKLEPGESRAWSTRYRVFRP